MTQHPPATHPISGMDYTRQDALHAQRRPVTERTAPPVVGERVWYRKDAHGPLLPAEVVAVDWDNREDWNVYRYVVKDRTKGPETHSLTGARLTELVEDPWPDVTLKIEGMPGLHATREARVPGSPGWLREEG